jgi:hypothetical protein
MFHKFLSGQQHKKKTEKTFSPIGCKIKITLLYIAMKVIKCNNNNKNYRIMRLYADAHSYA